MSPIAEPTLDWEKAKSTVRLLLNDYRGEFLTDEYIEKFLNKTMELRPHNTQNTLEFITASLIAASRGCADIARIFIDLLWLG